MPPTEALQAMVFHTSAELQLVETEWAALWERDPHATPFQSPQWLLPWARSFAADHLLSIAVYRNENLAALLPLYIHTHPETRERQLLLLGAGISDYLGCIADTCGTYVFSEIEKVITSERGWDIAHLSQLRSSSPLMQLAVFDPGVSAFASEPCFRILLAGGGDLPPKLRGNLGYYRRRAEALGPLRVIRAGTAAQAAEFFESLVELHCRRWQKLGEPGVLADSRILAHHRAAIPLLHAGNILRVYALLLNAETIAIAYALVDAPGTRDRSFYYYLAGFDPDFSFLSPGTLLLAALVENARAEGAVAVDLPRGNESYKKLWGAQPIRTYALSLPPPVSS